MMTAPLFVATYPSSYSTTTSSKSVTVTTQPGDTVVVYGGLENGTSSLSSISGNGLTFTLQQSIKISTDWAAVYVWTAVDAVGGTDWTLDVASSSSSLRWGFTCAVFRNSDGIGASSKTNVNGSAPSLALTTTGDNSSIVVFSNDWNALSGSSRTWRTVNGITPTSGNGLELDYTYVSGIYTVYGAYYNDTGVAGSNTVGLSAPSGQKYSIIALEVFGTAAAPPSGGISFGWIRL